MAITSTRRSTPAASAMPAIGARAQALLAMVLGVMIVGFVGFSHIEVIHNAAHDTRHANGFPCH